MKYKVASLLLLLLASFSSVYAANSGDVAPECSATDSGNNTLNLKNYRNKVVYLDFWASWCPPCKQSFPILNQLHSELNTKGFEVIAINLDENQDDASEFLASESVNFSIFFDQQGKCPEAYQVAAMPSSYIIDKQGVIKKVYLGFDAENEAQIRATVSALLDE